MTFPGEYAFDAQAFAKFLNDGPKANDLGGGVSLRQLHVMLLSARATDEALVIRTIVSDRDTGMPRPIEFEMKHGGFATATGEARRQLIRRALLDFCAHEIDELLLLDGERDDPHGPVTFDLVLKLTEDASPS